MEYKIEYSPAAHDHLRALTARQRGTVVDEVDKQLTHEPEVETRNRKPLRPNPIATWELRVGDFRVYYILPEVPEMTVAIVAVGKKVRDRVLIGNEEIDL